ncbi:hypothetical protein E4U42_006178 [Claviceps africana]|uniref:Uncharacterized protein n=1 Tax=Claviceps africana TaxID=83212 RepID=A0A8K0JBW1_9HYPO|nr:hypothetical protein E4U42_006178 [Claviceps africana]
MSTNPGRLRSQEHLSGAWPSPRAPRARHRREKRLGGRLHEGWEAICVGTALCDFCSRQSRGVVQKCARCGLSICSPCSRRGALRGNRNHRLDHDALCWDKTALEPRRNANANTTTRAERSALVRIGSSSGDGAVAPAHGPLRRDAEQARRNCCEKGTQTPVWWVPGAYTTGPSPAPDEGPSSRRADEHDAASILAGMPLSGATPGGSTMRAMGCRTAAAENARLADDAVLFPGGQDVLLGVRATPFPTGAMCGTAARHGD